MHDNTTGEGEGQTDLRKFMIITANNKKLTKIIINWVKSKAL